MTITVAKAALLTYLLAPADWGLEAKKRISAIHAAGEPTNLSEYADAYYRVGKGENAAVLYSKAFSLLAPIRDTGLDPYELPVVGVGPVPTPPNRLPKETLRKIKEYLDSRRQVLALLDAAARMDRCVFDLDFTQENVITMGHRNSMREMTKVVCLEALYCTETADTRGAARALTNAFRLTNGMRNEPGLIAMMVREATGQMALGQVERLVWRAERSPTDLHRLQRIMGRSIDYRALERAIVAERCYTIQAYQRIKADPAALKEARESFAIAPARDLCYALDVMDAQLKALRWPCPQCLLRAAAKYPKDDSALDNFRMMVKPTLELNVPGMLETQDMVQPGIFSQTLSLFGHHVRRLQRHIARIECARSALAVKRFDLQQGRMPERLAELEPKFIESVPLDPFDGKPIRFRRVGNGFAVYSVGVNLTDDGAEGRLLGRTPDVVFRSFPPAP